MIGRVFVVDDDESSRRSVERLCRATGLLVETYASATAFLAHASHDRPSCLILDLNLPELDGLDLQQRLAEIGNELPVIFISGQADVPSAARAMRQGAIDFLVKPPDVDELLHAIALALMRDRDALCDRELRRSARERLLTLTPREGQVARLVSEGRLNKQIAAQLGMSEKTVKIHRGRMMRKLQVRSVAALVRLLALVPEALGGDLS